MLSLLSKHANCCLSTAYKKGQKGKKEASEQKRKDKEKKNGTEENDKSREEEDEEEHTEDEQDGENEGEEEDVENWRGMAEVQHYFVPTPFYRDTLVVSTLQKKRERKDSQHLIAMKTKIRHRGLKDDGGFPSLSCL